MKKILILIMVVGSLIANYSTHSRIAKTYSTSEAFKTIPVFVEIALGNVEGYQAVNKFGDNPDIDTATTPEDIWDYGGEYTFSTTADISQLSSSSSSDVGNIQVYGLDSNWMDTNFIIKLNGQTNVHLPIKLIRAYRMINIGSNDFVGNVCLSVSNTAQTAGVPSVATNVRAYVYDGNNQTLMAIYTIPAGKKGVFLDGYVTMANDRSSYAILSLEMRPYNGVFSTKGIASISSAGSSFFKYAYAVPVCVPAKTDILIKCTEVGANDTAIAAAFDILLIDE